MIQNAQRQPLLAAAITGDGSGAVYARPAGSTTLDFDALATAPPGFFPIGDAVLSFDPIALQGLFHALATAESAAGAIERYLDRYTSARESYVAELLEVQIHYRARWLSTYAGPAHNRAHRFWLRRIEVPE